MMSKKNTWEGIADDFDKRVKYVAGVQNIEMIQTALGGQALSGEILELGCGNGTYSEILAEKAGKLYVTDISQRMISVCRQRLGHLNHVVIEQQDCFQLSYPEKTFDAVVMANLLHVIPDPEKALRESRRVLKKNGTIIIVSFTTQGMRFFHKIGMICRYLRVFGKPPGSARTLTLNSTRSLLESEGFLVKEVRLLGITTKAVFVKAIVDKK